MRTFQIGNDGVVSESAGSVVGDRHHRDSGNGFDLTGQRLGNQGGAAEGRARLDKECDVGMVFFNVVHLQDIVHRFARVFDPQAVGGEDLLGVLVKLGFRLPEDLLEVSVVDLLQRRGRGQNGPAGQDAQVVPLDEPFALGTGDHLRVGGVGVVITSLFR